jgi:hypothetical protein
VSNWDLFFTPVNPEGEVAGIFETAISTYNTALCYNPENYRINSESTFV